MSYNIRNFSLEFLQKMTREQAMEHFGYGGRLNYRQLVANIIVAATALRWDETRGVREVWYNPIKAIILRLFPEVNEAHGNEKKYKQFDWALSNLTKARVITYRALGIVDYRTMRELYESMDKANCWSNVVLFIEKDSSYIHLLPLKDLLNITIISGGGWSKTGGAEASIAGLDKSKEYDIYVVSDYDPYGFDIGREATEKLGTLGLKIKSATRIAINPDQIGEEIKESQKYPVKMNLNLAPQWCEEYGLPSLHNFYPKRYYASIKHCGFGFFEGRTERGKFSFDGGGAMCHFQGGDDAYLSYSPLRASAEVLEDLGYDLEAARTRVDEILEGAR